VGLTKGADVVHLDGPSADLDAEHVEPFDEGRLHLGVEALELGGDGVGHPGRVGGDERPGVGVDRDLDRLRPERGPDARGGAGGEVVAELVVQRPGLVEERLGAARGRRPPSGTTGRAPGGGERRRHERRKPDGGGVGPVVALDVHRDLPEDDGVGRAERALVDDRTDGLGVRPATVEVDMALGDVRPPPVVVDERLAGRRIDRAARQVVDAQ
jgi:hypothetical protein